MVDYKVDLVLLHKEGLDCVHMQLVRSHPLEYCPDVTLFLLCLTAGQSHIKRTCAG